MKLKLWTGTIDLPCDLSLTDRKTLVEKILSDNPVEFAYTDTERVNRIIEVRLDVLATYLLNAAPDPDAPVMSRYKVRTRPKRELTGTLDRFGIAA